MTRLVLIISACAATIAWAQFKPKAPPEQPIPFNHKQHAAIGIKCLDCHTIKPPGDAAGIPAETTCMGCHASVKKDSPGIAKLAAAARDGKPLPWVRVYRLPKTIYFSHDIHYRKAKADCAVCHGPVAEREVIGQEKSIAMADCMSCHDRAKAPNDCNLCHDSF